jgi:hypothetical protein
VQYRRADHRRQQPAGAEGDDERQRAGREERDHPVADDDEHREQEAEQPDGLQGRMPRGAGGGKGHRTGEPHGQCGRDQSRVDAVRDTTRAQQHQEPEQ